MGGIYLSYLFFLLLLSLFSFFSLSLSLSFSLSHSLSLILFFSCIPVLHRFCFNLTCPLSFCFPEQPRMYRRMVGRKNMYTKKRTNKPCPKPHLLCSSSSSLPQQVSCFSRRPSTLPRRAPKCPFSSRYRTRSGGRSSR